MKGNKNYCSKQQWDLRIFKFLFDPKLNIKLFILTIYSMAGFVKTSFGQTNHILLGTTEFYFKNNSRQYKKYPYIGVIFFIKDESGWKATNHSTINREQNFNILYKGTKLKSVHSNFDTTSDWHWSFPTAVFNSNIPYIGKKTFQFAGMGDEFRYRPLIFTNSKGYKSNNQLYFRPATTTDSLVIQSFLINTAKELKLGNLDTVKNIIKNVNRVLIIHKDVFLVEADINLNMYCFTDKVPFDTDISYFERSGNVSAQLIARKNQTSQCYFLVNNKQVSYIDYGLKIVDNVDLDNDGYDELVFRFDKYNNSGYILLTDKWKTYLTNSFVYH